MEFLKNPLIIGGLIPMIGFGLYNVLWKKVSMSLSLPELILGIAAAGVIASVVMIFFGGYSVSNIGTIAWWKVVLVSFLWVISVTGLTLGFMAGGSASTLIPIVNANTLISVLVAVLFMGEAFSWNVAIGSVLIVIGSSIIVVK